MTEEKELPKLDIPEYVGAYLFGEYEMTDGAKYIAMAISLHEKPNFIKRFCMKYLLGFRWKDR